MAKTRMVNTRFWSDGFIREKLNPLDRYLYLYLLTNDKTNISGIYELPMSIMSSETGIESKTISDMLVKFKGRVEYKNGWVILINFLKYQNTASKDIQKGIEKSLNEAPKSILDYAFTRGYRDGLGTVYRQPEESESESELKLKRKELAKASLPLEDLKLNTTQKPKSYKEFRDTRRVESGRPPMTPRKSTEKQKAFLQRAKSLDYFHDVGVKNGFTYLEEEDEQANKKFIGISRAFEKRYPEKWKEVIDWWFSENNAWCDYHPSNFFSISTWMKFDNKKIQKYYYD